MADMLVTPEELASYLQQDLNDRNTAELVIATATGMVQATCRQRLVAVAGDSITMLGEAGPWIELPERPVTAVTAVQLGALTVSDWTLYADPRTGRARLWRNAGWQTYAAASGPYAPPLVSVTYDHGWPAGAPALELARSAVLMLAAAGFRNPNGVRSEAIDDYQVSYADAASQPLLTESLRAELRRRYGTTAGSTVLTR